MTRAMEWWRRLPGAWRLAIVAAVVLRAGLAVVAVVGGGLLPGLDPVSVGGVAGTGFEGWPARAASAQGWGLVGAGLERFDALWYLAIAAQGYPVGADIVPQAAAFFPAFPGLVSAFDAVLPGGGLLAANVVTLLATIVALAGIHRLAEQVTDDAAQARRAVLALAVFPTALFLLAPYSESLFLAASTWALVLVRRRFWLGAAAAAALAGLTRNVGVLLAIPLAVEALRAVRDGGGRRAVLGGIGAAAGGPAGAGAYLLLGWLWWGTPLAAVSAQGGWQRVVIWPWDTATTALRFGLGSVGEFATGYHTLDLVVVAPAVAATAWLLARRRWWLGLYALAHVLVWLTVPFPGRPLLSAPRFVLAVAPVFVVFGAWLRRDAVAAAWLPASGALLGISTVLYTGWYYVF